MRSWSSVMGTVIGDALARMRPDARPPRLAVLIDADGISPRDAQRVLDHVPMLGQICVLRVYGNFASQSSANWTALVRRHGAIARHLPNLAQGKNASDIALAIDAIELLLSHRVERFVIIASDSDFTPLAQRIREAGKDVIGFGHKTTPEPYRRACAAFHDVRAHSPSLVRPEPQEALWSRQPADAEALVLSALLKLGETNELVPPPALGEQLVRLDPGFDSRIYSRRTLSDLVRALSSIELVLKGRQHYVRRLHPPD